MFNPQGEIMRHYEIVFMVHPDQSDQVPEMIESYKSLITKHQGVIHRLEDAGRRTLAYQINKLTKAHYVLMNVEINNDALAELKDKFKYNDAILRNLIIVRADAVTTPSVFMREEKPKYTPRSNYNSASSNARTIVDDAEVSSHNNKAVEESTSA